MDWSNFGNEVKSFFLHIPATLRETFIWFLISYIIPIVNIVILWGIKQSKFSFDITILSIVIVTNACFLTALLYQTVNGEKKRKVINTIAIVTLIISVVLFAISIIEIEKKEMIFPNRLYKWGTIITLIIPILLGLVSKYDEVEIESKERAKKAKEVKETNIGGKDIKI